MRDAVVWLGAALFAAMGVAALVRPTAILAPFGVPVPTADGRNEVRAVYGGFGVAVAALLGVAAADGGDAAEGIVIAVGIALLGMAAGRLVGGAVERASGFYPVWFFCAFEIVLGGALLAVTWA
jgi:hypothetical protein